MTTVESGLITEAGVYDLTAEAYHRDPVEGTSLSSSGARSLLPPSCPALFRYRLDHPPTPTAAFDLGHAAHRVALGAGADMVVVDAPDWRTKAAKEQREEAHAAGRIPVLADQYVEVLAMAQALKAHPLARRLLDPDLGRPEQTIVWRDEVTGVWRRAMLDWLPDTVPGRRMVVPDYKTTASAHPRDIARSVANFGYALQASWYLDAVTAAGLTPEFDPAFVFIAQEKEPPYLVTVFQLDEVALAIGRERNRRALEMYRDCTASGIWPGYTNDIEVIALPRWAERQQEEDFRNEQ